MRKKITIAIDAMGGENSPKKTIECVNIYVEKNQVICPHPRSHLRNFVLFPIFEIEKNWFHPKKKQSVTLLLRKLHLKSLSSIKIFSI